MCNSSSSVFNRTSPSLLHTFVVDTLLHFPMHIFTFVVDTLLNFPMPLNIILTYLNTSRVTPSGVFVFSLLFL